MDQVQPPRTGGTKQETVQSKAGEAAHTAMEHTRQLGDEIAGQARNVAGQVRERLSGEAQSQNDRLATTLRHLSDELETMRKNAPGDSLAAAVVQRLSEGSRQAADYLRENGPDGMLREVQEYARRKPGTFLLTSAVAGFVIGRVGKGLLTNGGTNGATNGASGSGNRWDERNSWGEATSTGERTSMGERTRMDERTDMGAGTVSPQPPYTAGTTSVTTPSQPSPSQQSRPVTSDRDLP